ncbi:hypothetical protein GCM10011506_14240 [Marivirga lumbricoides]|uniref:AB hydrolase-1 domain-containing protein n=1 Tax=Marivirga lumbricoides TaxID=1046115 RepID=A0ABQ1LUE6_9BACT|nr:hypothetical protein GCM10011506_14240 [Marivirga lumbricoides]
MNYEASNKDSIDLFVRKFPAAEKREGSIWLIPGGPGESGASMYPLIEQFSKIFPKLDILVPDHRGTGLSGKICPEEESIDSPNGISLVNEEWGSCFTYMYSNQNYVQAFSITNAANDLNLLIQELSGAGKKYVYGVSYGTQLIMRFLQLKTVELDGVILDSFVPLQDDNQYDLSQRSFVTNEVGKAVLAHYDKGASKRKVSLTTQMQNIIHRSKTDTVFAQNLPKQDLSIIFGMMLDVPKVRNNIPKIIKALSVENFEPLNKAIADITQFYNSYGSKYSTSASSIPLVQVISSSENNLRMAIKKSEITAESENLLFTSPLPKLLAENSMPTYQRDSYYGKVPASMPPTLILHGTLDPKTPLAGAIKHFEKLPKNNRVTLVKVKDAPHFIALFAPDSFESAVSKFARGEQMENIMITDDNTSLK